MATHIVTGDQYRTIDARMSEIKRQLNQKAGSPLDPRLVEQALQDIINDCLDSTSLCSPERAASIMGPNIITFRQSDGVFGGILTREQRKLYSKVPFSPATLKKYSQTHVLFAYIPLSINTMLNTEYSGYQKYFDEYRFVDCEFSCTPAEPRWYLVARDQIVEGFFLLKKSIDNVLADNESKIPAAVMAQALILWRFYKREELFKKLFPISADSYDIFEGKYTQFVSIGSGTDASVEVYDFSKTEPKNQHLIGLATQIKPEQ